jgi:glycosyltransferase involved in cell wall biosynthesis
LLSLFSQNILIENLLHFGLIRKYKGLDLLIKSLKKAIEKDNMIHLINAGEFYDDIKKYEELILKLKLKNNITIENKFIKKENIYKWFSAADFIMQTNTSATQSGVSSLSIYFEKIMITTAAGGINETLNENNSFI